MAILVLAREDHEKRVHGLDLARQHFDAVPRVRLDRAIVNEQTSPRHLDGVDLGQRLIGVHINLGRALTTYG